MKLFISYARVDKPLCKQVVERLQNVHDVWYDRRLHAGQEWWNEIQERLSWCDGFVYLLSPESVASEYCQKEYAIAVNAGKHIFPVLIQARTTIPESLNHIHYADLSEGMEDIITLMDALIIAERLQRKLAKPAVSVQQPEQPSQKDSSPVQVLAQVADAMDEKNYDHAVFLIKQTLEEKKPSGRMARMLNGLLTEAESELEKQTYLREAEREYAPIRELVQRESTRKLGCQEFTEFQQDFPNYDPDDIANICLEVQVPIRSNKLSAAFSRSFAQRYYRLPAPFSWIEIPNKGYSIAKYPVTNAQFANFIEAGGYNEQKWWTEQGWRFCQNEKWTKPRYWMDSKLNGANQPVVGISWFESVAFCLWLSDITGQTIMLPTEDQWQYAAQGDDGRVYPWGNEWDCEKCNNSVSPCRSTVTTSVTHYEGKGDSPFGVVDMVGNVLEWCLTDYRLLSNDINISASYRVLRSASGSDSNLGDFRCDFRNAYSPNYAYNDNSFRLSRVES